jgi:hypothetical protein
MGTPIFYIVIIVLVFYHATAYQHVAIVPRSKLTRGDTPLRLVEEDIQTLAITYKLGIL